MMKKILLLIVLTPVIYLTIAAGLIVSQSPKPLQNVEHGLDFSKILAQGANNIRMPVQIDLRDGGKIAVRQYGTPENGPLVVMVHGSGWHGMQFDFMATQLSNLAHIAVPDLRGHGINPERRGDVDHIGQFEEDLANLVDQFRLKDQKVILIGHSSGGGLVARMAGGKYADKFDAAVLIAPFLKYDAPTTRPNSGDWAVPLTRRIIGLSMLNQIGITQFNHLDIIQFNMPRKILNGPLGNTATTAYSYRLNSSFAPRADYLADVAKLPEFLLIAGENDEAFFSDKYEPTMSAVTDKGRYRLIPDVGHLDVVNAAQTIDLVRDFLVRF